LHAWVEAFNTFSATHRGLSHSHRSELYQISAQNNYVANFIPTDETYFTVRVYTMKPYYCAYEYYSCKYCKALNKTVKCNV